MALKNHITFKMMGILSLALCTPLSVHYFFSSPPATSPHRHQKVTFPKISENSFPEDTVHSPSSADTEKTTKGVNNDEYNKNIIIAASIGLAITVFAYIVFNKSSKHEKQDTSLALASTASSDHNKDANLLIYPSNNDSKNKPNNGVPINLNDQQQNDLSQVPSNLQKAIVVPPKPNMQKKHSDNDNQISSTHTNHENDSLDDLAVDSSQNVNNHSNPLLNNSNYQQPSGLLANKSPDIAIVNDDTSTIHSQHSSDKQQVPIVMHTELNIQKEHNDNDNPISSTHANHENGSLGDLALGSPQTANNSNPLLNNSNDQQPSGSFANKSPDIAIVNNDEPKPPKKPKPSASHTGSMDKPPVQQDIANQSNLPKD